jgi:hypothetical protein
MEFHGFNRILDGSTRFYTTTNFSYGFTDLTNLRINAVVIIRKFVKSVNP